MTEEFLADLNKFLDTEGRLTQFPAKKRNKILVLLYLAEKFEEGHNYTEKDINEIIDRYHTFQDKWLLRRELINNGFLDRIKDGSKYWKPENQPELTDLY